MFDDLSQLPSWAISVIIALSLWGVYWKGVAMWFAAQKKHQGWFIVLLLVNTVGILDMIYIFGVAKIKCKKLFGF